MRGLRVLPAADADIDEAADYYANHASYDIALRFLTAVREAFAFISENPEAASHGQYHSRLLQGIRRWPVHGFENHLVFYRLTEESIEIVRVIHGARDIEALFDVD